MLTRSTETFRPVLAKEKLALGSIDSTHVNVLGIIPAAPQYAYPLERAHCLRDKPFRSSVRAYQESPIWDWAGELLAQA